MYSIVREKDVKNVLHLGWSGSKATYSFQVSLDLKCSILIQF